MDAKSKKLEIAIAPSRMAKTWKNVTWTWGELVDKCRKTKRTGETSAEYNAMTKAEQAARKDVGGFVGGTLKEGKRRNGFVTSRSCATLDIDYGTENVWEDFTTAFDCAAMIYSTHKHSAKTPRYRLVVPFSRSVEPWEYEPICRRIADHLGIEMFDHTTYELPRLFYWPSTSEDGEYVFNNQEGEPLDVDAILATYRDAADASEWPTGKKENVTLRKEMRKAGDPLEKRGLIGAFCRTYSVGEAIDKFLSDVYEATAQDDRYTYAKGSVAGGLVVYDDLFAYSHHDTDPASRQLCNAFDLVRVHLFGELDEDSDETEVTRKPSYLRMTEFAGSDSKVTSRMANERRQSAEEDFSGMGGDEDETEERKEDPKTDDGEWTAKLDYGKDGNVRSTIANVSRILSNDPAFKGKVYHDDFTGYDMAEKAMPWPRVSEAWSDKDDAALRLYLESHYGISGKEKISDALDDAFMKRRRHPVREYLKGLKWDGVERLDTLIIDYIGAEDNKLTRAMTRKQFTAAVRRVFAPGCKHDYCLILAGGEGIGKSTLLNVLGGPWFSDSVVTTEGKEGMESLRQAWIIELAELASIRRSDVEQVKSFISKQEDRYRAAYGKRVTPYPRQCVFFGTTNEAAFLKGDTGNRRFWVIQVDASLRKVDGDLMERLKADRDQIWAEAYRRHLDGESLYLSAEMETEARDRQQQFNVDNEDPLEGMLDEYLSARLPADWYNWDTARRRAFFQQRDPLEAESIQRDRFFAGEFLYEFMGYLPKDSDYKYKLKQVNKAMRSRQGWEPAQIRINGYGSQKGFVRSSSVTK